MREALVNPASPITAARPEQSEHLFWTLVQAFETDPLARWICPDLTAYRTYTPGFMKGFGGRAIAAGSAYCSDSYAGVALWLPPGIPPDEEAMLGVLQLAVPAPAQAPVIDLFMQMGQYHPEEPHWYLPIIGVAPAFQGTGLGAALMKHALLRCDSEHCAAYLESSSPRNVPLYERHGFEVIGTIQAGSSPPIFPMLRRAR